MAKKSIPSNISDKHHDLSIKSRAQLGFALAILAIVEALSA
jgi:hypothetical protein